MVQRLIQKVLEIKDLDLKQTHLIAKELALIDVSLLWYPDKLHSNLSRLKSLSQHVIVVLKHDPKAMELSQAIKLAIVDIAQRSQ